VYKVAEYLREEERATDMSLTIYESRNNSGMDSGLEAVLTYDASMIGLRPGTETLIARSILTAFESYLGSSPPWGFSPLTELDLLVDEPRSIAPLQITSSISDPNDLANGEALVLTTEGEIGIFKQAAYTRLAWRDYI
jgi:hypothetical protein